MSKIDTQPLLFEPIQLRGVIAMNRLWVAAMCQYSCMQEDGMPQPWHMVHLGSFAVGRAGLIISEATAVRAEGRISPHDVGIWNDEQAQAYRRITAFMKENGAVPGIQLAHAGRKASTAAPWEGGQMLDEHQGGWSRLLAPSALAFSPDFPEPQAMSEPDIQTLIEQFAAAAQRSLTAGFEVAEVHAAHGYLLHQFLSPLANQRTDAYGGSLENRMRLPLAVIRAVRDIWPAHLPLFVRVSATDWAEGGWDLEQSVEFARQCKALGVDLIDVSTGGLVPDAKIPAGPGFQVPFAEAIKTRADIATGAVGFITAAPQAEQILVTGQADVVLLARESLRDPQWPLHAAHFLGEDLAWPKQYERAKPR